MQGYEVIESRRWLHTSGATASLHGAVPWHTEAQRAEWIVQHVGYTVRNPITGQVGIGCAPCSTREQAEQLATRLGRPSAICLGD